jgi:D-lactate dehydrogenase
VSTTDPRQTFIDALVDAIGQASVLTGDTDVWAYGQDNSRKHNKPLAVVLAEDPGQVKTTVTLCNEHSVPVTVRGRGTGTAGGAIPSSDGIVLSLERMDNILRVDPANRFAQVQAGVLNQTVQDTVADYGFFWPPDPTSAAFCTVGGNVAVNSAGPRALKYGTTRDNVLGLKAITGTGDEIHTGVYTTKGVVGYDLTRLIIGSEGTLAVVTEVTLKLVPLPETTQLLQAVYRDIGSATDAIVGVMSQPNIPRSLEFMDAASLEMVRNYSSAELPQDAGAMLLIEVDGSTRAIDNMVETVTLAATNDGLMKLSRASNKEAADALWATRKALSPALKNIAPNKLNEDVVVPVSRIPELIQGLTEISRRFQIPIVNFGHAGNGNIHVNLLYDSRDPEQARQARPCLDQVFDLVLKLEGTLSGEHGIGMEKRDYIAREIDPVTLELMRRVKSQFDPGNILNPGKIFPVA